MRAQAHAKHQRPIDEEGAVGGFLAHVARGDGARGAAERHCTGRGRDQEVPKDCEA
jgi:hypothetical protein